MAVSYKKLFHLLIEKEMSNADLQKQAGFSARYNYSVKEK
jgi:putative transcriptional regulator